MVLYFIWLTFSIIGIMICFILSEIKIELRYRNILLRKQNDILNNKNHENS
jgi:hypothetical protein